MDFHYVIDLFLDNHQLMLYANLSQNYKHKWEIRDGVINETGQCRQNTTVWNPYIKMNNTVLNNVQYGRDCGPDSALRCAVGDLTGKLGTINLGERIVLTDSNLPLTEIAGGRSLAIFGHGMSKETLGCANITNDEDITKYTYIVKPTDRFNLQKFLSQVRGLLRAPAWLVSADPRVSDHGECLRLLMRFRGPGAGLLMKAFEKVMEDEDSETPRVYRSCLDRENKRKKGQVFTNFIPKNPVPATKYLLKNEV